MIEFLKKYNKLDKKQMKINMLENRVDVLESTIKDELYKEFMNKLSEPVELERYKKENKYLRNKVKVLQGIIRDGDK